MKRDKRTDDELVNEMKELLTRVGYPKTELAKRVGVSFAWIHRVLNQGAEISDELRANLIRARDDLRKLKFLGGHGGPPEAA